MDTGRINGMYSEPLAGCRLEFRDEANYALMVHGLMHRLKLVYDNKDLVYLIDMIFQQAHAFGIDINEFKINEMQYEYRRLSALSKDKLNEKQLLNRWVQIMMDRYGEDAGLDFFTTVTENRRVRADRFRD